MSKLRIYRFARGFLPFLAGAVIAQYVIGIYLAIPLHTRTNELRATGIFTQPGSSLPLLGAFAELLAVEWPTLTPAQREERLVNLEALVRLAR